MTTINELFETRNNLFEIAAILYGEDFVFNEDFWGSQTDKDLQDVYEKLDIFGYEEKEPTPQMVEDAKKIMGMVERKRNSKNY